MQKQKNHRNAKYLAFIRQRPCSVSGHEGEGVVAHHVRCLGGGGTGLKPTDYYCVPLTAMEHRRLHDEGEKRYWARHGLNPSELINMNLLVYLASRCANEDEVFEKRTTTGLIDLVESLRG